jgi:hypothetical protein
LWTAICPISGTCLLSTHLPFQALFTESSCGDQILVFPPSPVQQLSLVSSVHPAPSVACSFSVPCLLFSFFLWGGFQSVQGTMLIYPRGSCGNTMSLYLLTCWSASPKEVWSQHLVAWEPSCFLSVMWHGVALYGLEVQGVRVLFLIGVFFLPSVAPASQQNF